MSLSESAPAVRPKRTSRDEMNLAEFPLTVLSTRASSHLKTLEFKDSIRSKDGRLMERCWIITGADKFGLPTASDDEVLLGLLKLTVDRQFKDPKVFFTRYELLKILRWTTEGRSYVRLQRALDRLSGVRIKATNAFFDNETKCHSTRNFGIIDAYEINDGRSIEPKPSFFKWSDVIFKSFQVGFIKKLDLEFYLDLRSAVSKRLYRYLDKRFWYKPKIEINLFLLAHEKVGISRNYRFASALRQQLDPALDELKQKGFLSSYSYEGKGADTTAILVVGTPQLAQKPESQDHVDDTENLRSTLIQALTQRGLKASQSQRLLGESGLETLQRVGEIVQYFDSLRAANSKLVSRSPVGFLYRAVEKPHEFVLPGEGARKAKQNQLNLVRTPVVEVESGPREEKSLESRYLIARKCEARRLIQATNRELLSRIRAEVEDALAKIKPMVSERRFEEGIQHGLEEQLLKLSAFPDFQTWSREQH